MKTENSIRPIKKNKKMGVPRVLLPSDEWKEEVWLKEGQEEQEITADLRGLWGKTPNLSQLIK